MVDSLNFQPSRATLKMQIDFTPEQQDFVRQAIASARFARPEDAVQAAMGLWVERERRRSEILAAAGIAKASICRRASPRRVTWCIAWHRRRGLNSATSGLTSSSRA